MREKGKKFVTDSVDEFLFVYGLAGWLLAVPVVDSCHDGFDLLVVFFDCVVFLCVASVCFGGFHVKAACGVLGVIVVDEVSEVGEDDGADVI